tara:strand:- start:880 stop:1164 length:285 start_codon:yes stop_codon:yes gene_type:complete
MTATSFWIESPLPNVEDIIANYAGFADETEDLSELYTTDHEDFKTAVRLFREADAEGLAEHVSNLDTEPREVIVIAFHADLGTDFVREILGYEI